MKNSKSDSLVRAGFVILVAYGIYQAANFFYHFISARMLGPAEYSIVASLFSIIYLVSMGSTTIQNTITKFTAEFNSKKDNGRVAYLFNHGLKKLILYSAIFTVVFLIMSPLIADFLKIPIMPVLILSLFIMLSFVMPLNRGILQGLQRFKALGVNMVIEGIIKLILLISLIYLGLKANGAIAAVAISTLLAFCLTFPLLKFRKEKSAKIDSKEIYNFSFISFIALFLVTALYNVDIVLVKHFFSAESAGHYAVLSLLGKVIFFAATSIGLVMFPKIAENSKNKKIFLKSLLFALIVSAFLVVMYFLFSNQIVGIAFGNEYMDISGLIGMFGIFMTFLSLSYICVLHKLASGKKKFILNILIAVIIEIIAITLFHENLIQIISGLIIVNALLLLSLLK